MSPSSVPKTGVLSRTQPQFWLSVLKVNTCSGVNSAGRRHTHNCSSVRHEMSAKDTHDVALCHTCTCFVKLTVSFALRNMNPISHKCPLCFVISRHQHPSSLCFQHNQLSTDNVVCDICFYSDVETRNVLVCLPGGSTRFGTKDDSVHDVFVAFGTAPGAIQPSLFFAWETFNRLPSLSLRYHIRN